MNFQPHRLGDETEQEWGRRLIKHYLKQLRDGGGQLLPWSAGPTTSAKLAIVAVLKQLVPVAELLEILGYGDGIRHHYSSSN